MGAECHVDAGFLGSARQQVLGVFRSDRGRRGVTDAVPVYGVQPLTSRHDPRDAIVIADGLARQLLVNWPPTGMSAHGKSNRREGAAELRLRWDRRSPTDDMKAVLGRGPNQRMSPTVRAVCRGSHGASATASGRCACAGSSRSGRRPRIRRVDRSPLWSRDRTAAIAHAHSEIDASLDQHCSERVATVPLAPDVEFAWIY